MDDDHASGFLYLVRGGLGAETPAYDSNMYTPPYSCGQSSSDPVSRLISRMEPGPERDALERLLKKIFYWEIPGPIPGYAYLNVVTPTVEEARAYTTNMVYDASPHKPAVPPIPPESYRYASEFKDGRYNCIEILSDLATPQGYPANMIYGDVEDLRSKSFEAVETRPASLEVRSPITNFMYDCYAGRREEPPAKT